MSKPVGVQIQRCFALLVGLILVVCIVAVTGSTVIFRSVRVVVDEAVPLADRTESLKHEILAAQQGLFRYLAEFSDDTSEVLRHLDRLAEVLAETDRLAASPQVREDLETIKTSAERYRKVVQLLPGTVSGSRDWSRLQEYSATAVALGTAVEEGATRLAESAQAEIQQRSGDSARIANAAMWISVAVFALSMVVILALRHWWKQFQELLLGF